MAELRGRATQKWHAVTERLSMQRVRVPTAVQLQGMVSPEFSERFAQPSQWSTSFTIGKFFPSFDDPDGTLHAAMELDAGFRSWCLDRADRAMSGRFDLLGYSNLDWGMPIDWHREPLSGVRAPSSHWSTIPYLDPGIVGDHKLLWELNRHQFLVTIAQASRITQEQRFAAACYSVIDNWMTANPPGRGVNWASSLEVAFRAISWIWALRILPVPPSPELALRITGHLVRAGNHLERYLSTWFSPNTHLTGEALGLLYLGTQLPHLSAAARWRDTGWQILTDQLPRHIQADGVYFEQATWYHRYTVDFYLHAILLAEANGLSVSDEMRTRVGKALEYLRAISRGDGTFPIVGDDDGGKLAVLDGKSQNQSGSALAIGGLVLDRSDLAASALQPGAEVAWLLGAGEVARFQAMSATADEVSSQAFRASGSFVMRSGKDGDGSMMLLDCGVHGAMNCGHAHADILSFDLTVGTTPVFVDPGTGSYTADPERRDRFRSSMAHNTVTIDGQSSSLTAGPFQWRHVANPDLQAWESHPELDFLCGSHDGYEALPSPAVHRRAVLFVKGAYWVIQDEILSAGDHDILQNFQLAPGLLATAKQRSVRVQQGDTLILQLFSILAAGIGQATLDVVAGLVSPAYGRIEPAAAIQLKAKTQGHARFFTLLTLPGVTLWDQSIDSAGGLVATVVCNAGRDSLRVGPRGPWQLGKQRGDAAVQWSRTVGGSVTAERTISDGSAMQAEHVSAQGGEG